MSDIGFDGIFAAFAAIILAVVAVVWAVAAFVITARRPDVRGAYVGAVTIGGYAFVTYALASGGARQVADWVGVAGLLVAPILAIVLTVRSRKT